MVQFTLSHNYRETNLIADWLAKFEHELPSYITWQSPPSSNLKATMGADLMGRALVRRGA